MDIDTARLRAFLEVTERGTVAAAAAALGYTAPAISQQLSKLEAQLGGPVFDRVGGRLRVNERGERLIPIAHEMLDLTRRALEVEPGSLIDRQVVIAGFASALRALAIPLLRRRAKSATTIVLREIEDDEALRELRLGHVDIALVQEYDGVPAPRPARLTATPLVHDRLRLLVPTRMADTTRLDHLGPLGWLVNGAGTRCEAATQRILIRAGVQPRITGWIADNQTLLALVAAGHGATIAPELVLRGDRHRPTIASQDLRAGRTILAMTRAGEEARYGDLIGQWIEIAAAIGSPAPARRRS